MRCPAATKIDLAGEINRSVVVDGAARASREGKVLLRKVLGRIADNTVASRPKQGFSAPDSSWLDRILISRLSEAEINRQSGLDDYVDSDALLQTCTIYLANGQKSRLGLWSVLTLNSLAGALG